MQEWYRESETQLGELVIELARKIVLGELKTHPEFVLGIVRNAVREIAGQTHARLRVNPIDSAFMKEHAAEIIAWSQGLQDIEIVDDISIAGGCVFETDGGIVDASVDGMLDGLKDDLRRAA